MLVRSNLQIIFNAFIAIDGAFSECEADVALEILDKIDDGSKSFSPEKEEPATVEEYGDPKSEPASLDLRGMTVEGEGIEPSTPSTANATIYVTRSV